MRRCIFHIPNALGGNYGSHVRPPKMIQGFQDLGYEVDVVMGYAKERKAAINRIKKNIKDGVKYDFVYSESSTVPTLLTENHHLPTHPFLDFGFIKYCKKNGIKTGLFYRDIYWKFPEYKEGVHGLKYMFAISMYHYDLWQYGRLLEKFYVPNKKVAKYVAKPQLEKIMEELPPGAEPDEEFIRNKDIYYETKDGHEKIKLFYVGGIGSQYAVEKLFRIVGKLDFVEMTFCCRQRDWEKAKIHYEQWLCERIHIVHDSGKDLEKHYRNADICMAWFKPDLYREMAMPIKLFEYLGRTMPVIAAEKTAAGEFVVENDTGWCIAYSEKALEVLLKNIQKDYSMVREKRKRLKQALNANRWISRAQKVAEDM